MIRGFHYIDGKWVKSEDLKISTFDLAVLRGYGCFDLLRTYQKKPFKLDKHLKRLSRSAKFLNLKIPINQKEIKRIIYLGIKKNKFPETNIRIILTGGISDDSLFSNKSSLIIQFTESKEYPRHFYDRGIKILTFLGKRTFPSIKSLDYLQGIYALKIAKKNRANEILYVDDNKIYECSTSNFFAIINNKLVTPKDDILNGITREIVLDLAKKIKITTEERELKFNEIRKFQSAFITSTTRGIMPVIQIDNFILNNGKIHEIVKLLMVEFKKKIIYN